MAAAYAALVSLFNNLELIQTHPRHSFSFDNKQIQTLLQIVCFLIDFMEAGDYPGGSKESAEVLERQIACAAHAAEDVIESHVVDQIHAGSTLDGEKRSVFVADVQKVIEDMELVRREASTVQNARSGFKADQPTFSAPTPPTSGSGKDKMVGFDEVLSQLVDLLTGSGNPSSLRVIPIVGPAGIGKTALAENAFRHPLIVPHFHTTFWIKISKQDVAIDILSALLPVSGKKSVSELGKKLHRHLYGKRYMILLDDMWSAEAWDEIKHFFPDSSCGSCIIVTCRQSDVANHFGSLSLVMSCLKKDESWDLFCHKAFAEQSCPLELEEAGKKIVEKCGGLPLAIIVVGGHLRMSPRTKEFWENVANHMNSILNSGEKDGQVFDILYLIYSHLPVHLKPCFLYMGVFSENSDIFKSLLMRLWIGEGFLKPNKDQTLEEVAESCLNDLISRNLILVGPWRWMKKNGTCMIHDVLREFCLEIVEKEKFFCVFDTSRSVDKECRVVIYPEGMRHVVRSPPPLVRSQITWGKCKVLFNSKLLRVVKVTERSNKVKNIYERVNLRFVDGIFQLNPSISLLWNLQTLIVKEGCKLTIAPYEIWELTQLRHLKVASVFLPDPLPSDEANGMVLRNLQTLKEVINLRLSDEVCKRIPNIKKLKMTYDNSGLEGYCDEAWSYCPHNLGRLHKLESLYCSVYVYHAGREWHEFARALAFPNSLKKLKLWGVRLSWEEITMKIGSLPLLEVLYLGKVKGGAVWNSVEGGFPRLRSLHIHDCFGLTNWNAERSHFPVLEHLYMFLALTLDELGRGIGEIPTLQRIHLKECCVCLCISALRIVVEQEKNGNHNLQLHVEFEDITDIKNFGQAAREDGLRSNHLSLSRYSIA